MTTQLPLGLPAGVTMKDPASAENRNQSIHRWVPWIAGFSGNFVSDVLAKFLSKNGKRRPVVVDPFCGVGTTLVEGLSHGFDSVGFEINPYAVLASQVKTSVLQMDLIALRRLIFDYRDWMLGCPATSATPDAISAASPKSEPPPKFKSRIPFFSERILHQVLATQDFISSITEPDLQRTFQVALGAVMVSFSNYSYEPSLGTRPGSGKALITDAPVATIFEDKLKQMLQDATVLQSQSETLSVVPQATVYKDTFFNAKNYLSDSSADLVVTSPPYLNNYHYVRNTRPQLWWLGLVDDSTQLRELEQQSMGKFWQSVRDCDPIEVTVPIHEVKAVVDDVRRCNVERGSYGGPGWSNYAASYFNDLNTFAELLSQILRPEAHAVVVIGNSIIQGVEIKVDRLFSAIAALHGMSTESIEVIRAKRVGSSIVGSSVRSSGERRKIGLYDAAVILRKTAP